MMEVVVPTVLMVSVILLTAVFLAVGFWLMLILRQVKKSFSRVDQILDKVERAAGSVEEGFSVLPRLAEELHDSAKAFGVVKLGLATLLEFLDDKGVFFGRPTKKARSSPASKKLLRLAKAKTDRRDNQRKEKDSKPSLRRRFFFKK